MNADCDQENGNQTEEDGCVDKNRDTTRLKVSELDKPVPSR